MASKKNTPLPSLIILRTDAISYQNQIERYLNKLLTIIPYSAIFHYAWRPCPICWDDHFEIQFEEPLTIKSWAKYYQVLTPQYITKQFGEYRGCYQVSELSLRHQSRILFKEYDLNLVLNKPYTLQLSQNFLSHLKLIKPAIVDEIIEMAKTFKIQPTQRNNLSQIVSKLNFEGIKNIQINKNLAIKINFEVIRTSKFYKTIGNILCSFPNCILIRRSTKTNGSKFWRKVLDTSSYVFLDRLSGWTGKDQLEVLDQLCFK